MRVVRPPSTATLYTSPRRAVGNSALSAGSWIAAEKITYFPSGVKATGTSLAELRVRRNGVPPVLSITNISKLPSRSLAKAILLPSGDHIGDASCESRVVSRVALPPPVGTVNISPLYVKAIREPSGDIAASRSHNGVTADAVSATADSDSVNRNRDIGLLFIY